MSKAQKRTRYTREQNAYFDYALQLKAEFPECDNAMQLEPQIRQQAINECWQFEDVLAHISLAWPRLNETNIYAAINGYEADAIPQTGDAVKDKLLREPKYADALRMCVRLQQAHGGKPFPLDGGTMAKVLGYKSAQTGYDVLNFLHRVIGVLELTSEAIPHKAAREWIVVNTDADIAADNQREGGEPVASEPQASAGGQANEDICFKCDGEGCKWCRPKRKHECPGCHGIGCEHCDHKGTVGSVAEQQQVVDAIEAEPPPF